jgi:hypothetical protein
MGMSKRLNPAIFCVPKTGIGTLRCSDSPVQDLDRRFETKKEPVVTIWWHNEAASSEFLEQF